MSKPGPVSAKKRKIEDGMKGKTSRPNKRIRKQKQYQYHSSSEDEGEGSDTGFAPVNLADSDSENVPTGANREPQLARKQRSTISKEPSEDGENTSGSEAEDDDNSSEDEDENATASTTTKRKTSKRNDPEAFSTSISKILSTKLSQSARKDPVLSRSRDAVETSLSIANERLEQRARAKLRAEKKDDLQRGRIKDVTGISSGQAGAVAEEEKRLRKIAQRGVVKLFNAVRASQVKAEQALREERKKGIVGHANREEKATEMSKQGFLELINRKQPQKVDEV